MQQIEGPVLQSYIEETVEDLIDSCHPGTDREDLLEDLDTVNDELFCELVQYGQISQYTLDDMVETGRACLDIIDFAKDFAWVEDDSGLWAAEPCGALATIAYFSLRNCLIRELENQNVDIDVDYPFEVEDA